MILQDAIDEFLLYLSAVRNVSPNTVVGYKNDLFLLKSFIGEKQEITSITKENLLLSIGNLSKQHRSSTSINRYILTVMTLFAYCKKFCYIEKNTAF